MLLFGTSSWSYFNVSIPLGASTYLMSASLILQFYLLRILPLIDVIFIVNVESLSLLKFSFSCFYRTTTSYRKVFDYFWCLAPFITSEFIWRFSFLCNFRCLLTLIVCRFSISFGAVFSKILSLCLSEAVPWSKLLFSIYFGRTYLCQWFRPTLYRRGLVLFGVVRVAGCFFLSSLLDCLP